MATGRGGSRRGGKKGRSGVPGRASPRRGARVEDAGSRRLGQLADELIDAAERVGLRVRHEKLLREVGYHAQSGVCRVGDEEIVILDSDAAPDAKVDLLSAVLAGRDLSAIAVSDEARASIESSRPADRAGILAAGPPEAPPPQT